MNSNVGLRRSCVPLKGSPPPPLTLLDSLFLVTALDETFAAGLLCSLSSPRSLFCPLSCGLSIDESDGRSIGISRRSIRSVRLTMSRSDLSWSSMRFPGPHLHFPSSSTPDRDLCFFALWESFLLFFCSSQSILPRWQ